MSAELTPSQVILFRTKEENENCPSQQERVEALLQVLRNSGLVLAAWAIQDVSFDHKPKEVIAIFSPEADSEKVQKLLLFELRDVAETKTYYPVRGNI